MLDFILLTLIYSLLLAMLILGVLAILDLLITDGKTIMLIGSLIERTKFYKLREIKNDYKKYLSDLEYRLKYQYSVAELPFSVIQPLLHNGSPIIHQADKEHLALKKDKYDYERIYIKFSKEDYKKYHNYICQKEENKKHIKQTEDTLLATKLIQAELNRINEEALKVIEEEREKLEKLLTQAVDESFKR